MKHIINIKSLGTMLNGKISKFDHVVELNSLLKERGVPSNRVEIDEITDENPNFDIPSFETEGSSISSFMDYLIKQTAELCTKEIFDNLLEEPGKEPTTATESSNYERMKLLQAFDDAYSDHKRSMTKKFSNHDLDIYLSLLVDISKGIIPESYPASISSFYFNSFLESKEAGEYIYMKKEENEDIKKLLGNIRFSSCYKFPFIIIQKLIGYANVSFDWIRVLKEEIIKDGKCMELLSGSGVFSEALRQVGCNVIHTIDNNSWMEYHDSMKEFYRDKCHQTESSKEFENYFRFKYDEFIETTNCNDERSYWMQYDFYKKVEEKDAIHAVEEYGKECDFIIISYPPMDDTCYLILKKMREVNSNCKMILLSEAEGGNCASDEFFEIMEDLYPNYDNALDKINKLRKVFSGYYDYVTIVK